MNKEFILLGNQAIVRDSNDNLKKVDYTDNLEDKLIQENIIETMEKDAILLDSKINEQEKTVKKVFIPWKLILGLLIVLVVIPGAIYAVNNIFNINLFTIVFDTTLASFKLSSIYLYFCVPFITFLSLIETTLNYISHRENKKNLNGMKKQVQFLKRSIIEQKEKLAIMNKDKTYVNHCDELKVKTINLDEQLNSLKNRLILFYNFGHNEKKYYRLYKRGRLTKKMSKKYNDKGIELIKRTIAEEKDKAVKRKIKTKKIL